MSCLKSVAAILAFCWAAAWAPGAAAAPDTLDELARYQGADRHQRLVEGAKKEGALLLYIAMPRKYAALLIEPFEKQYGIKVDIWQATGETILQKALNEARAGKPVVDVIHSISPVMEALQREDVLQEVHSPVQDTLLPAAVPAHHKYAATLQYVFVQAYNTDKVKKKDLPRSYQDLLDPKWKNRLAIEAADQDWMASVIEDMGQAEGERFFTSLVADNGLSVRKGHTLLTNLVAAGEVPLALTVYQYSVQKAKEEGAPIDWFAIEPAVSILSGMGVARKAPHPHAALLFYDYLLSPQGQRIYAQIGYPPTSTKVESPLDGLEFKFLDGGALFDNQQKNEAQFRSILGAPR